MSTKKIQMFGFKFLTPVQDVEYQPNITVPANVLTNIGPLTGELNISLEDGPEGFDNQWIFTINQGSATNHTVGLPEIEWVLDIAPTFLPGSITEIRLHKIGDRMIGVWN